MINSSSLDLIQTCLRKADYILNQKLIKDEEASALAFGTSIHRALEHWYTLPLEERHLDKSLYEQAELMGFGHGIDGIKHGALESIRQFVLARYEVLKLLDQGDKRGLSNGIKILIAYFKNYAKDSLVVLRDDEGPFIERDFSFILQETPSLEIHYFGRIDVILQDIHTGTILIADHKTTAALGKEFYNRLKPNSQYAGYIMGAQKVFKLPTNLFMVNGIQVAKTKHEFARQITDRSPEDLEEFRESVIEIVHRWLRAQELDQYPMTAPNPCTFYGGCPFLDVCSAPQKLRPNIIKAKWNCGM